MKDNKCLYCKAVYKAKTKRSKYCSARCKDRYNNRRRKKPNGTISSKTR